MFEFNQINKSNLKIQLSNFYDLSKEWSPRRNWEALFYANKEKACEVTLTLFGTRKLHDFFQKNQDHLQRL